MNAAQNAPTHPPPLAASPSTLSFTQGFLLGQLSIVLLLGTFIKFFIFGEPSPSPSSPAHHPLAPSLRTKPGPPSPSSILAKTYYNPHLHPPESLDWFNVLIAQTIASLRADALADSALLTSLTTLLNGPPKPPFLAAITVTDLHLGDEFPIFSNCRVRAADEGAPDGRLQAWMDVDLGAAASLAVETRLLLNFPRPCAAVLPVALSVGVERFSGTLSVSFVPAMEGGAMAGGPTSLAFSFLPGYTLVLGTRSLLGSRSRLQDVPKVAQLVERRLRMWFEERCVQPRMQRVAVPSLWPRMRNVVEGEGPVAGVREREGQDELRGELGGRRDSDGLGQGLRWRGGGLAGGVEREFGMPGAMPGMMVA
ncbi:ERMES complex subunit mmm1 [Lambiella insularis]|nr:ERMES complex subunit mmm1 [Lambiella insularis]